MKNNINIFVVLCFTFIFSACNDRNLLRVMQEFEEGVHNPSSIAELKNAINKYEERVNDIILAENRIAIWYKMLGVRYMENKMYKKALEAFQSSLEYYPENQNLYYQIGVCASHMAKDSLNFEVTGNNNKQVKYYDLAVSSYSRALEIDPKYRNAAYALSVLYVYELNDPEKAIVLLEPITDREKKPINVMFVLGAAYYLNNRFDDAINIYEKIMEITNSDTQKNEAENNIKLIRQMVDN